MRIAQVAPLIESVPPRFYGGTERIVSYLTEALVARGHEVTLYASGDSITSARLVACAPRGLRLSHDGDQPSAYDPVAAHFTMMERVYAERARHDIVHFHIGYLHFPWSARGAYRHVTTLHGRLDVPELVELHRAFPAMPMVSISDAQREPLPELAWARTIHHGLPLALYAPRFEQGRYLVFIGRFSPEKRVDRAIEIAIRAGVPLKIAAKIDESSKDYFEEVIQPLLAHPLIEWIGEVGQEIKERVLGDAAALLLPIDWPEPFGLVTIEALACGTPVIAWRRGAQPELIDHGVTGWLVDSVEESVRAIAAIDRIDRRACRRAFEARFSAARMTSDYVALYQQLIEPRFGEQARGERGRSHPDP